MSADVNLDAIGVLLSVGDWDRRDDGPVRGPYGIEITAPRPGELMISTPDPHGGDMVHVTVSGPWSFGLVADLATHLAMMARLVARVRNAEGDF